jgi:hypothetical protein
MDESMHREVMATMKGTFIKDTSSLDDEHAHSLESGNLKVT